MLLPLEVDDRWNYVYHGYFGNRHAKEIIGRTLI
jgi:hypothetical protein